MSGQGSIRRLREFDVRPNRELGQNFLIDDNILRVVGLVNFLDGCATSVPCHPRGAAPVGMMVCGPAMSDRRILAVSAAIEGVLARN